MLLPDPSRWARLSEALDDLLTAHGTERDAALARWEAEDPRLGLELRALLQADAQARAEDFLTGHAAPAQAQGAADAAPSLAGHQLGAYTLQSPLGAGGTGAVWLAQRTDGRYEGQVAIKLLHLALLGRAGAQRFAREGAILARLQHPHIARLLDAGVAPGGQPYLVLEHVQGERIDRHCMARQLDIEARLGVFLDVLAAVAHAHSHLVIHRDIKPGNILVTPQGEVKLLDFGIAKLLETGDEESPATELTQQGGRPLTPDWAAPEQLRGEAITTATDVYALGLLLHLLLTGRHATTPHGATASAALRAALEADPLRPSRAVSQPDGSAHDPASVPALPQRWARRLQGDLDNIVARCLRKAPGERYATVPALADDLRRHLAHEPVSARPDTLGYVAGKFVRRHRGAVAAGLLTTLAIGAGVVGTVTQARRATLEAARAHQQREHAVRQTEMATGVSDFFAMQLSQSAGTQAGGVRGLLERSRDLARKAPFRYPMAKVAVFQQLSARFAEIDDLDQSLAMLDEAIGLVQTLPDLARRQGSMVPLLCERANLLDDLARRPEAMATLDEAQALLDAGASVPVDVLAECGTVRSYLQSALGQHDQAVQTARKALQHLSDNGVDPESLLGYASALDRALLLAGRHAEAWPLALKLYQATEAQEGLGTMAALRRASRLSHLQRAGGQPLRALEMSQRDLGLMERIMAPGTVDALTLYEHGATLQQLARLPEALDWLQRSADAARAQKDVPVIPRAELALVQALLADGQAERARRRFTERQTEWDEIVQRQSPSTVELWRTQALLDAAAGRLEPARVLLDRAAAFAQSRSGPDHPERFALELALGELALLAGRPQDAATHATLALAAARRAALDVQRSADIGRALWLKSRAQSAQQQAAAGTSASAALAHFEPTLGAGHPLVAAARLAAR